MMRGSGSQPMCDTEVVGNLDERVVAAVKLAPVALVEVVRIGAVVVAERLLNAAVQDRHTPRGAPGTAGTAR